MTPTPFELVLAIHPFSRGYAFALFEGPLSPADWGVKEIRSGNRNTRALAAAAALMARSRAEILVLEDCSEPGHGRARRIRRLLRLLANAAEGAGLETAHYARDCIRECFKETGAATRYEIAQVIAARLPAFEDKLPRPRKPWEAEDQRMALFDAAALALTHYRARHDEPVLA